MSAKDNKAIVRRLFDETANKGNFAVLDELVAANYRYHGSEPVSGRECLKQFITGYRTAFPDIHITFEDMVADGDKVVFRWTAHGTHKGELAGIAPTGKKLTMTGISICRVAGGKVAEEWENFDELGMMQQLGAIPAPQMAGA